MRIALLIMAVLFFSCQKDEKEAQTEKIGFNEQIVIWDGTERKPTVIDETGARVGLFLPLFYKESLTTDNYLLYPLPRKQEAYNKHLVDSVYMTRVGTEEFNIDGIRHCFYDVRIKFKNQPTGSPTTYVSVLNNHNLAYVPYGVNVLHSSNSYKVMTIVKTTEKLVYPEWVTGKPKTKYKYTIKGDTTQLGSEYLFGSTPTGTAFLLPHK